MQPKISIIVPVYKVERYLRYCIDSILSQTFTNFELLLIDDGSPDNSGVICDEYMQKDSRVRVFHLKNGGAANARNWGLEKAVGELVTFVDSDDYISEDYLDVLVHDSGSYDIVLSGFTRSFGSGVKSVIEFENIYCSNKDKIGNYLYHIECAELLNSQCCKLFKKSLIDKFGIRFLNGVSVSEDMLFCFEYFTHIESVLCLNYYGYFYRLTSEESLSKKIHPYRDYYNAMIQLYKYRKDFIQLFNVKNDRYMSFIEEQVFSCFLWSLRSLFELKKEERFVIYKHLFTESILANSIRLVKAKNLREEVLMFSVKIKSGLILELYRYVLKLKK